MKILYIGEAATHRKYAEGHVPSHWLYGACEMERDGHEVIWSQETNKGLNDIKLIRKHNPDIIFIPNLNIHNHFLLLAIAHVIRIPIYAYLHHEPQIKTGVKSKLYKFLLGGVRHLFFLSEKSLQETVKAGLIDERKCSLPGWGPDLSFYSKVETSDNGWFVSTGKENRDFDLLIEAFRQTRKPLHIITAKTHNEADYSDLEKKCSDIPNIKVSIVENSSDNYPMMLREMAAAHALVCPLRKDKLNYCVGLSTVADAEGLNKTLIITENPYHDTARISVCGEQVTTIEDWERAISETGIRPNVCPSNNMDIVYKRMRTIMKL